MPSIMKTLSRVDSWLHSLKRPQFLAVMVMARFVIPVLALPLIIFVGVEGTTYPELVAKGHSTARILFGALILAPVLETLIGQSLPFAALERLKEERSILLVSTATIWFGILHSWGAGLGGFMNGFLAGIPHACTFWRWRKVDRSNAYWMTVGLHALNNLVATVVCVLLYREVF